MGHCVPASDAEEQRASYTALLQNLGQATFEEIEAAVEAREKTAPEKEMTPEVIERLQERLSQARSRQN
jgi:hypothetical protein